TAPSHGTVTLNADGSFTYAPAANYNGPDSFTYRAYDGTDTSNLATVSINVIAVNDPPTAADESYSVAQDGYLPGNSASSLLAEDSDVGGSPLTVGLESAPTNGTITLNSNGSFTYTPIADFNGTDTFTYRASDGTTQGNIATVPITVTSVNDV